MKRSPPDEGGGEESIWNEKRWVEEILDSCRKYVRTTLWLIYQESVAR